MTKLFVWLHKTTKGHSVPLYSSMVQGIPRIYKCQDCNWKRRQ